MANHKAKLTSAYIERIKTPEAGQDEYYDQALPGLSLRVGTSGARVFYFLYRYGGKPKRMKLGRYSAEAFTLADARKAAREAQEQLEQGIDPRAQRETTRQENVAAPTVKELAADYIKRHAKPNKRSWEEDKRILDKDVIPAWGPMKAKEVTRAHVIGLIDGIVDRGAPITANRTLAVVRRMFNFAVDKALLEDSPAWRVKPPTKEKPKRRVLSEAEIKTFWERLPTAKMDETTKEALRFILVTGQRPGEVQSAPLSEFEGDWWTIAAERVKKENPHRVFLSSLAHDVLAGAKCANPGTPWAFPSAMTGKPMHKSSLDHAVARNLEHFGLEKFTPHDLRRTFRTHARALGFADSDLDKVINHLDSKMRRTYNLYAYDKEKQQILNAWAAKLEALTRGKELSNVVAMHG